MMTNTNRKIRPAMTAIAAVLALSSTSLIAQTVTAPVEPTPTASALVSEPAPTMPATVAPVASDPLAPVIAEPVTADTTEAAPVPVKSTKSVAKTSTTRTVKSPSVAKSAPPVARSASPEIAKAAPVEPTAPTTPVTAATAAPVAPTVAEATPARSTMQADEVLPIADAAGAGLLALAGLGVAIRRRKRDEDEIIDEQEPLLETSHEQIVEPTFDRSPNAASPAVNGPVDGNEYERSKHGPNVLAAYCGPTADNPSLSLRKRLKRGAALDQMARNADGAMPAAPRSSPKPVVASDSFMLRPSRMQTSFRPVLQS